MKITFPRNPDEWICPVCKTQLQWQCSTNEVVVMVCICGTWRGSPSFPSGGFRGGELISSFDEVEIKQLNPMNPSDAELIQEHKDAIRHGMGIVINVGEKRKPS